MEFNENYWEEQLDFFKNVFNLSESWKEKIKKNKVAKLISALPFIVKSKTPERYSYMNFGGYLIALKNEKISCQKKGESIEDRIKPILNFNGGNKMLIERAKNLLILLSLEDHNRDIEIDKKNGKYNPIAEGDINYEEEKKYLIGEIKKIESKQMDEIVSPEEAVRAFWGD